jgi:predicted membrane-bound spermidine synthase
MVAIGGISALSWELLWQLKTTLAFGVSAAGTALTLAVTMAGMAAGSLTVGRRLQDRAVVSPLRLYGALELTIGLSGLLMPLGFHGLELLDSWIYGRAPSLASPGHVLGIILLLGPPTFAMGATIPVFQRIAGCHGTSVSTLYAINTAGAALGVLLFSFIILPNFGVWLSCLMLASLNFLVCGASFVFQRTTSSNHPHPVSSTLRDHPRITLAVALPIVFATGFATFGLEVAWFRSMRAAFWSTSGTFAIILASVLIPLALGARLVPWMRRLHISPAVVLAVAGCAILVSTPLIERLDLIVEISGQYYVVMAIWLGLSLAIIGPAMTCLGMVLPWCLEEFSDPAVTGRLYGVNTVGSVAGSLLAAWLLLPNLGFARTSWSLGVGLVVIALAIGTRHLRQLATVASGAALTLAILFASSPGRDRVQGHADTAGFQVLALNEGPDATTSVVQYPSGDRELMIDGFVASSNKRSTTYMGWMGSLPMLLHPVPERALVICFGTGQTANALRHENPAELDIVDLNRAVFDMAPFFDINQDVLNDPRVSAIVMDGRAWLRRTDRFYDVITLEPMPPNFAGVNSLYSREFYEIMANRLRPNGVVAQWLPFHLVTVHHATSVAATFQAVFPDAVLWIDPRSGIGILIGRQTETSGPLGLEWPGLARVNAIRPLRDTQIPRQMALNPEELARYAALGSIISDNNQLLSFSRIRNGLQGARAGPLKKANWKLVSHIQSESQRLQSVEAPPLHP